jgi:uncharacterized membrane protein YdbT with pleckstrin-like domain
MTLSSRAKFLKELTIFADLEDEELADLSRICVEVDYQAESIIAYQRDIADRLIIVRSGRLFAQQLDAHGVVRQSRSYYPNDFFEDLWLFAPQTLTETIRGGEPGRVIFIEQEKFIHFLNDYPYLLDYLNLSEEAKEASEGSLFFKPARQIRALNLLPDEIVEFYERRSRWLLVLRISGPMIALLVWFYFLNLQDRFSGGIVIVAAGFASLLFTLLCIWRFLDWANDYFVITNKHLIHREFRLRGFRATVNKTPIDQVQSVEIERPGLLATLLNVGTARITTAAQASAIRFDFINNPNEVKEIINRLREQVKTLDAGRAQAAMRASLEEHFETEPAYETVENADQESEEDEPTDDKGSIQNLMGRISRAISSRVEEGETVTYRKHFFTVFIKTWWSILAGLVFLTIGVLATNLQIALVAIVLFLIDMMLFIWRFEDWRNDTFQVTNRYVIDIDRRPFGFGESRKQAELGNVQNVNANRPGFLATVFNYGDVYIETAGASADITFERVVNPNQVQSDIFKRREEFRQKQQLRESAQRRKEYAVLLDVYQQAQEQDRLPRRTPAQDIEAQDSE